MATIISTGESYITIFYRLTLPDGMRLVVAATPLDDETGQRVIGFGDASYALITPLEPKGIATLFLKNIFLSPDFVRERTGLPPLQADLLAYLLPKLTALAPADDIADAADEWLRTRG